MNTEVVRDVVKCEHCGIAQFADERCRRCRFPLPQIKVIKRTIVIDEALMETNLTSCATLEDIERQYIFKVFRLCRGPNRVLQAAKLLDVPRITLYRKLKNFGVDNPSTFTGVSCDPATVDSVPF